MKLNLGCGGKHIPGFENLDIIYGVDAGSLPFGDNTVELIYASHLLEHLRLSKVHAVLLEWKRVLVPDGMLRVSVPDFPSLVHIYMDTGDISTILGPLYGRIDKPYSVHYTVYDFQSMAELLLECGYRCIKRYDWHTTEHASVDDCSQAYFPHMNKTTGIMVSLNVECRK